MLREEPDPVGQAVCDGPGQLAPQHRPGRVEGVAHPLLPRTAVAGAEPELEEELQVVIPGRNIRL